MVSSVGGVSDENFIIIYYLLNIINIKLELREVYAYSGDMNCS
jgi:hypothetical protein